MSKLKSWESAGFCYLHRNSTEMKLNSKNAWEAYDPTQNEWTIRHVWHLYNRAGFSTSPDVVDREFKRSSRNPAPKSISLLVDSLMWPEPRAEVEKFNQQMQTLAESSASGSDPKAVAAWWLYRMTNSPDQLREKMTLFWHGHFATGADKVNHGVTMLNQNVMLRKNALGKFETLVQNISRDPAMLIYLDSTDNRKSHPNENYARELLELFCLGLDEYTENDIQELARCFTGWQVTRRKFRFNPYQHDKGSKSFLGKTGNFTGEQAVKIVVEHPSTAKFVARKLIRFFCFDEPQIEDEWLEPLCKKMVESGFDIEKTIRTILQSNLFFSDRSMARKIISPVELVVGFLRKTQTSVNLIELANSIEDLGQLPLYPPNVKGWDGGRSWINASTLIARSNLIKKILDSAKWSHGEPSLWLKKHCKSDKPIDWLLQTLLAVRPANAEKELKGLLRHGQNKNDSSSIRKAIIALSSFPEFQLI